MNWCISTFTSCIDSRSLFRLELVVLPDVIFSTVSSWRIDIRFMASLQCRRSSQLQVRYWCERSLTRHWRNFPYVRGLHCSHCSCTDSSNILHPWICWTVLGCSTWWSICLIDRLIKKALRKQNFGRLWFWSLVCTFRITAYWGITWLNHVLLLGLCHSLSIHVITRNSSIDVLPLAGCSNSWRGLGWCLLLICAHLFLWNERRSWLLHLHLFVIFLLRVVHYFWRNYCWTFIGFTGCWPCGLHSWMVVPTYGAAHSSRILIQRLVAVLHLSSLLKFVFDKVHIFLRSIGSTGCIFL